LLSGSPGAFNPVLTIWPDRGFIGGTIASDDWENEMNGPEGYAAEGLKLLDVGVAVFDSGTRLVFANPAFRALRRYPKKICRKGVTLEALLRYNAERGDFGPGDADAQVVERLAEIDQGGEREIEREMADGQILRIRYRRTSSGGLLVTFDDRTAERRAQAALALSEERHTLVTQATSDGIYDWNVTDDVLYVSDALTRLLDFDLGMKASGMWAERVHKDDYERYVEAILAHFKGETEALECEYRVRGKGGAYRWIQDSGIGVRDKDGRVTRVVGAVRDITDIKEARAELDRTEARLLSSLATISDGILLVDADNRVQLWNDRYIEIFSEAAGGADVTEVIVKGRPFFDMIRDGYNMGMFKPHPDGVDAWVEARTKAWEQPASQWEMELGSGAWLLLNERRMPDGGRVSVYTDITELKRREQEALASQERFEEAIEAISSGFTLWDRDDRLVICNSRYREYYVDLADIMVPGASYPDILLKAAKRGVLPEATADPAAYVAATLKKRAAGIGTLHEHHLANGRWLQVIDHRTKDGGLVAIYTDVTELKNRGAALKAALEEFNAVLDNIGYGVLFMGPDLRARIVNRAFREIWQIPQEFIDENPDMRALIEYNRDKGIYAVAPDEWDDWIEGRVKAIGAGNIPPGEMVRADSMVLSYQCVALPDGGRMLTYFNITELKERETEITGAKDEAEAALANLQKAQQRLIQAEKMASLGQLTAGIAHEIKNPLNFVNNFAKLSDELLAELGGILEAPIAALDAEARDDAEDLFKTVRENLGKINDHGKRADSIVKNMLLHSREGPSERQSVNLNAVAEEALNLAYHGARAENPSFNIEMIKALDPDLGAVECFPRDLMRVFLNLINNGMYAANKRGAEAGDGFSPEISLTTRTKGGKIEIEVRDNGMGIPAEVREKIFTPFFTTKPAGEGTGLGLSLSYDVVVKQHGGELIVDSVPGEFTAIRVTVPRALPDDQGQH
jgi:PAS domain S-box-containing protein